MPVCQVPAHGEFSMTIPNDVGADFRIDPRKRCSAIHFDGKSPMLTYACPDQRRIAQVDEHGANLE
jgi:hypothetical protein